MSSLNDLPATRDCGVYGKCEVESGDNDFKRETLPSSKPLAKSLFSQCINKNINVDMTSRIACNKDLITMSPILNKLNSQAGDSNHLNEALTDKETADVSMEEFKPEELFKDPTAFDYLLRCTERNHLRNLASQISERGKDSLFVKFDPLYSKRGAGDKACPDQIRHEVQVTHSDEKASVSVASTKPTQVVLPAANVSPPMNTCTQELLCKEESIVCNCESKQLHDLKEQVRDKDDRINTLTSQNNELLELVDKLKLENEKYLEQNTKLVEKDKELSKLSYEKTLNNKQMSIVMEEYERTISSIINEQQMEKKLWMESKQQLISERDEAIQHLANVESSFNDVHSKYERCKTIIQNNKTIEDNYKKTIEEIEQNLKKFEELYHKLKQNATEQLQNANTELATQKKTYETEITKLRATNKKFEIKMSSLHESLTQKIKDNEKLQSIYDDLINKV